MNNILSKNDKKIIIKDDINFLEHPNWIVSKRDFHNHLFIKKDNGFYELKSSEGLPVRFDKIVLYYLLHQLSNVANINDLELITTRYEIAKNVFSQQKNFSKQKYDRIMLSLKRWKAITIRFEGIFLEKDLNLTLKYFSVVDTISLDKKTNELHIRFNDQYIQQLRESPFHRHVDFKEYKQLTRPVSARLYEIFMRRFLADNLWLIYVETLGEQLTLGKRDYPSQIVAAVKPAIQEINKYCQLQVKFDFYKETGICSFANITPRT
jgi:hypothetical protein